MQLVWNIWSKLFYSEARKVTGWLMRGLTCGLGWVLCARLMLMLIRRSNSKEPSALYISLVSDEMWPAGEYLRISLLNV